MLKLESKLSLDADTWKAANLTDRLTGPDLERLGSWVFSGYEKDQRSRQAWMRRNQAGMDLALQIQKDKVDPWPGCANVAFPLITVAAMQFHARAYPTIINGNELVKMRVPGPDASGEARARADRVSTHMSWQVAEQDAEWKSEHDKGLLNLSIVGCNFIKTFFCPDRGHNVSELVLAKDLVLNYYSKSLGACPRKTQILSLSRNDVYSGVKKGAYRDVLEEPWFLSAPATQPARDIDTVTADNRKGMEPPAESDEHTPFVALEQHVDLDLDQDGYAEPYIITMLEEPRCVLRIVCAFDRAEDVHRNTDGDVVSIDRMEYYTKYTFIPQPDGGVYDLGFGVLLGPLNESVNTAINQLFDAGTWASCAGGFIGRGAKIVGGVKRLRPYEWAETDGNADDLRKQIVPFDVRDPSPVLFNLLSILIDYTNRISGATDMMVGENPGQNTPAETARTMVEMGQKIYNAIFQRVWEAMKHEFQKLFILNAINLLEGPASSAGFAVSRADYLGNPQQIAPGADPNLTSDAQRYNQAVGVKQSAMQTPGYDPDAVEKKYLRALGISSEEVGQLYPGVEARPPGKSEKIQIAEMQLQAKEKETQQKLMIEAQNLQLDAARLQLEAREAELDFRTKMVELQGDVEDREVQRMNAMVSMMKSQADGMRARADTMIAQLESLGISREQLRDAQENDRAERELKLKAVDTAHKVRQGDEKLQIEKEKLAQGKEKLAIDRIKANKPTAKAA